MKMHFQTVSTSQNTSSSPFLAKTDEYIYNLAKNLVIAVFSRKIQYFFKLLWPFHSIVGCLLISNSFSQQTQKILDLVYNSRVLYIISQTLLYSFDLILIFTFFAVHTIKRQGVTYSLLQFILRNFSIVTKINFFVTSFFLYTCFEENILAFTLASFTTLLESLFIQNYTSKKQENYLTSPLLSLTIQILVISNVLMNCIIINYSQTNFYSKSLVFFGILSYLWFLKGGNKLFLHQLPKNIILISISLSISIGVLQLISLIDDQQEVFQYTVEFFIIFIIVSLHLYFLQISQSKILKVIHVHESKFIKQYQQHLTAIQEQSEKSLDQRIAILGLASTHQLQICNHNLCWTNTPNLYDPFLKQDFNPTALYKQRDSTLKFYIKCLYQRALKQNKSKQLMIDYCQFMATQFPDFSTYCLYISELMIDNTLSLLQKIKICKIKIQIEQMSASFNKGILGGRVELLDILNADIEYNNIMEDIAFYCKQNASIWKHLIQETIDLSSVKTRIKQNMHKLHQIDGRWKKVSPFFYAQKQWKQVYLNYYLYIKNNTIKNKDMQQQLSQVRNLKHSHHNMFIKQRQRIFEDKINDCIFFDKESIIFVTELINNRLFFSKIGKSFQSVFHYHKQEVIGSPLDLIIPKNIQKQHHQKFNYWLQTGQSANESKYYGKLTKIIKKQGAQFTALVFYKIYFGVAQQQSIINFACLLNTDEQNQNRQLIKNMNSKASFFQNLVLLSIKGKIQEQQQHVHQDISIDQKSNIFLKDDQLQPREHNYEIFKIKVAFRIITIVFVILVITCGFAFYQGISQIQSRARDAKFLLTLYRYPIGLSTNYLGNYLNLTNSSKITSQITSMSNYLLSAVTKKTSIKILSDQTLNMPSTYAPISSNYSKDSFLYDQIDLFYVIYSCLTQLASKTNVGRTSQAFIRLDSYLKPSFDLMANKTKIRFHHFLQNSLLQLKQNEKEQIIVVCCIFLLGSGFVWWQLSKYFQKSNNLLQILLQLDQKYIQKIMVYWQSVSNRFDYFHQRYFQNTIQNQSTSNNHLQKQNSSNSDKNLWAEFSNRTRKILNEAKLNQKRKNGFFTQQTTYKNNRRFYALVTILLLMSAAIIAVKVANYFQVDDLQHFQDEGFNVLRHYPNTQILGYALINRYYSQNYPNQTSFIPERFIDTISTLAIMSQYEYPAQTDQNCIFQKKYKNYFFGNPCTSNSSVLSQADITLDQCLAWGKSTFPNGISVYLRYLQPQIQGYLGVSQSSRRRNLRKSDLMTIASGLSLIAYYIQDLMNTWFDEFSTNISILSSHNLLAILLTALGIIIVHLTLFQLIILPSLKQDYAVSRMIFMNFVPEQILMREKLIRQNFHATGIIE